MQHRPPATGLEAVIHRGASRRPHRYLRQACAALPAAASACMAAVLLYVSVMFLAGRSDWQNILGVALAVALIPLVAISFQLVGARQTHPVTMSLAAMTFATCFAVSVVSALRIPTSYVGILATFPSSLFFVTVASVAMARDLRKRVAILAFHGAEAVAKTAGWPIPVVEIDEVNNQFQKILIDPDTHHSAQWSSSLARLYLSGVEIESWPRYVELETGKVDVNSFDLAVVSYSPSQIVYYRAKRFIDIFGVLVLAVPAFFICALIWFYIRIVDGGPSLFVQERRGYGGCSFRLYKFRTMYKGDHVGSTAAADHRVLPGCRLLRQLRLDELPQLVNILRGEMSFIGPRPVSVSVAKELEERTPIYVNRYIVLPGLTGWAQVSQGYAETHDEELEKLAFDLFYLKHVSLDLDIIVAFRTVRTILLRFGAR